MKPTSSWLAAGLALGLGLPAAAGPGSFDRSLPTVHLGTLGDPGAGAVPLTDAIRAVLEAAGEPVTPHGVAAHNPEARGLLQRRCLIEYQTAARHYAHVDCPGHTDYVKNMISGAAPMDGAILVVSAADGPLPQTREHVLLARQIGVPSIVVFLDRVDEADAELLDLVELEVRELLRQYEFPGDSTPVIRGSSLRAAEGDPQWTPAIRRLLEAVDDFIPTPARDRDRPFLMPIEDVFRIEGRGTVVTGRVERGSLRTGQAVEAVGFDRDQRSVVQELLRLPPLRSEALPGDKVGAVLADPPEPPRVGQVLAEPGSIAAHSRFRAEVYVLRRRDGGRHTPFFSGYRPQFSFRTADVTGTLDLAPGSEVILPGDHGTIDVELIAPIAMERGQRFTVREGKRPVGVGVVSDPLGR